MKIPIPDDNKPLTTPHKLYLIVCVAMAHGFIDVVKGLGAARWSFLRQLVSQIFRSGNIVFATLPLLIFGLSWSAWNLYETQKAEHAAEEVVSFLTTYEFLNKPLPSDVFSQVELFCSAEGAVVSLADKKQVLSSKFTLTNKSEYPILMRLGGKHTIHMRARLWNSDMTKVVKEGVPILLDIANTVVIHSKGSISGVMKIKSSDLVNVPNTSKYLVVGVVQEHIAWASTNDCKFEVKHEGQ